MQGGPMGISSLPPFYILLKAKDQQQGIITIVSLTYQIELPNYIPCHNGSEVPRHQRGLGFTWAQRAKMSQVLGGVRLTDMRGRGNREGERLWLVGLNIDLQLYAGTRWPVLGMDQEHSTMWGIHP